MSNTNFYQAASEAMASPVNHMMQIQNHQWQRVPAIVEKGSGIILSVHGSDNLADEQACCLYRENRSNPDFKGVSIVDMRITPDEQAIDFVGKSINALDDRYEGVKAGTVPAPLIEATHPFKVA